MTRCCCSASCSTRWTLRLLRRHARKLFFDVDDAIMFHAHPVGAISRWRTQRRFRATARAVDHVVAGNRYLADLFAAEGATTSVIPTVVDPARYRIKSHEHHDVVSLVWIGSKSTIGYVSDILPSLRDAAKRSGKLKLITIADVSVESSPELPVEHIPWSAATEVDSLLRGDIGIAPTPRDPWTLGQVRLQDRPMHGRGLAGRRVAGGRECGDRLGRNDRAFTRRPRTNGFAQSRSSRAMPPSAQ